RLSCAARPSPDATHRPPSPAKGVARRHASFLHLEAAKDYARATSNAASNTPATITETATTNQRTVTRYTAGCTSSNRSARNNATSCNKTDAAIRQMGNTEYQRQWPGASKPQ